MYYYMDFVRDESFLRINDGDLPEDFVNACRSSEFQYLDHKPAAINVEGSIAPDFLVCASGAVPLISVRLYHIFDRLGINNLFIKRIDLVSGDGVREKYYLALPPRIKCLDMTRTKLTGRGTAEEIYIDSHRVGNYRIFKPADVRNCDIIVTSELAENINQIDPVGINFFPTEND